MRRRWGPQLRVCSVVERDGMKPSSLPFVSVLKHSALVLGQDVWSVLGTQAGVM